MKNAAGMTSNGSKLSEMSLPPLRHPEDTFADDQYSQSDLTSTAGLRAQPKEGKKEHAKFPVAPLPVRDGASIGNGEEDMRITDTLPSSSWLQSNNQSNNNTANSSDSNISVLRTASRYTNDPTVASKTTFASCIVEVGNISNIPIKPTLLPHANISSKSTTLPMYPLHYNTDLIFYI